MPNQAHNCTVCQYRCLDREFSVEQSNVYFTLIGQAFHELWQFETRHANA